MVTIISACASVISMTIDPAKVSETITRHHDLQQIQVRSQIHKRMPLSAAGSECWCKLQVLNSVEGLVGVIKNLDLYLSPSETDLYWGKLCMQSAVVSFDWQQVNYSQVTWNLLRTLCSGRLQGSWDCRCHCWHRLDSLQQA